MRGGVGKGEGVEQGKVRGGVGLVRGGVGLVRGEQGKVRGGVRVVSLHTCLTILATMSCNYLILHYLAIVKCCG